jgi:hypothetical protein
VASVPVSTSRPCRAQGSTTGNFQVNCAAEDTGVKNDLQFAQREPSIVAFHSKVVSAFNDGYGLFGNPASMVGYSVSHDGGVTWTDMGAVPQTPTVQPISDPSLAVDAQGNVWLTTMADTGPVAHPGSSELGLWEMPAGSDTFRLVSTPVVAAVAQPTYQEDYPRLAIGTDARGKRHLYITFTRYAGGSPGNIRGPVVLLDSTNGVRWRSTTLTGTLCEPGSPGGLPVPDGGTVYVFFNEIDQRACADDPQVNPTIASGLQEMIAVDARTARIERRVTIAAIHGVGEVVSAQCGGMQMIQTAPGLYGRQPPAPAPVLGPDGVLYLIWPDRPHGLGGGYANATRIYLSYSRDHGRSWSRPAVISGPLSATHMADRFQPALTADAHGLHAIWYQRVADPRGGPDLIRTDRADLTLAGASTGPRLINRGERTLSTVSWQYLPNQCYEGDYIQVFSNGTTAFAAWTDLRNTAPSAAGVLAHNADIFADHWPTLGL